MKKILSLLVIVALMASMLVSTAFAAGTAIYVESVNAKAGEEVTIDVSISGNTGFAAAKVSLVYDSSVLTLKSITPGLLKGGAVNEAKGIVSFASATNVMGDGVLLSATFAVADNAPDGAASVSVNVSRLADADSVSLNPSVSAGGVSVKNPHTHSYDKVVTAPTCTDKGYTTYTCACGESYKADEVAALDHKWDNGTVTTPATEGKPGVRTYKCATCGTTKTEEIPALDHTHKYTSTATGPTCTKDGYITYTCTCGDSYQETGKKAEGHGWEKSNVVEPTCGKKGSTTYLCATCGETKTEEIAALDHKWKKGAVTEPTCNEKGSTAYKCATCGETKSEEIAAVGHKWDNGTVVTKPTCTEKGSSTYKCTVCGESKTEATSALGHKWDNGTVTVEPTDTADGTRTYKCSACGETKTEKISALSHTHENTSVVTEPTCTEQGYTTYTCSTCGEVTKGDYVDAKGHNYATTWTWNDDYSTATLKMVCKGCLNAVAVKGEDVTIKVETTQPQKGVDGKTVYTASAVVDGKTYSDAKTVVIPASEAAGGSTGLYIGIGVAVIVIAAGAVVVLKKKKKVA